MAGSTILETAASLDPRAISAIAAHILALLSPDFKFVTRFGMRATWLSSVLCLLRQQKR